MSGIDNTWPRSFHKLFDKVDMFGMPAPTFSIAGKDKTTSSIGFLASVILKSTLLVFIGWRST